MTRRPRESCLKSPGPRFCMFSSLGHGTAFKRTSFLLSPGVCMHLSPLPSAASVLPFGPWLYSVWNFLGISAYFCFLLVAWVSVCPSSFHNFCPFYFSLSMLVPGPSGLHRHAVWPGSRGCVHHGLQLPAVCTAGLCHCTVQL